MPKRRASPAEPSRSKRGKRDSAASEAESGADARDTPKTLAASPERREALLAKYPSCIPSKLAELDEQRFSSTPAAITSRSSNGDRPHMTKDEFVSLVEWKLKHGTFRPALLGMAKQHPPELVVSTTSEAFALLFQTEGGGTIKALKVLTALRGIGPATASLFLSCVNCHVPFFSDEMFRWMMWDEPGGGGWNRKIKYTEKEYKELLGRVEEALSMEGMEGVSAWDLEKIAYILARE
ncbi:uncharacterized protein MKK02DRAFT_42297 [Dioszegia hungarica]|uniref:Uncharacterized protein n=1 Tax=Dioszegia hungarica TaxID=4972 RepID=A0AA38LWK6_9TREE|nr:uncharacterized protein MKK02DRAFT_42297 [Dioszegia hungarica]KAI9637918.1 hypothetical protein MKK02DRAFT_42297 [Dioszegia hungarica]